MVKAIIFDMDGVISDTQKIHSKVESSLLGDYGIKISLDEITMKYSGVKTSDFFTKLAEQNSSMKYPVDIEINSINDLTIEQINTL